MRLSDAATSGAPGGTLPIARREDQASHPVHGSWSATRWQYTSRADADRVVDVVAGLGGSVTLSLSDGTWVLTWAVPGRGNGTVGGSLAVGRARLDLLRAGPGPPESLEFHQAPDTLALSSDASHWDFGEGEEPADFVAVLVRL